VTAIGAAACAVGWGVAQAQDPAASPDAGAARYRQMVNRYCVTCHNERARTAGVLLDKADLTNLPANAELWERVGRKLRANAMPPQGMPRPTKVETAAFVAWLETSLDRDAANHPNPGRTAIHRLNRAEYANAIRDLLGLEIDTSALLPPDDSGYGFDNNADVLSVSPLLTERYLSAARRISRIAVGDATIHPATDTFAVNKYLRQDDRLSEDLPFGSRGGIAARYYFPVDGDYYVKVFLLRTYDGRIRGLIEPNQLEVRLNGIRIKTVTIGGESPAASNGNAGARAGRSDQTDGMELRFSGKAGPGLVAVDFLNNPVEMEGMLRPKYGVTSYEYAGDATIPPGIASIEIRGPYDVKGPGNSPSRERIFVCHPAAKGDEERCARQIVSTLATRAYRRPVGNEDLHPLMAVYNEARGKETFDGAIEMAVRRILVSPEFLFRMEHDPPSLSPGTPYRVSDLELASRLSFFLWGSIPDDELLQVASRGQLKDGAVLERQVQRMLNDQRVKGMIADFAGQWLWLRNIPLKSPDPVAFPNFDANLQQAFARELELFTDSQIREDHSVLDLLTADYTYVNERLANHYGISNVYGTHFRRVQLTQDERKGLLGKGGILMLTSYPDRTSPVQRGKWLLENILGAPPPPPPPGVGALKDNTPGAEMSMRQRMEAHRANPACSGCHKLMDPLGFAMENFDAVGHWRTTSEAGTPVDASGELLDGTKVDGPVTLRNALLAHKEDFVGTVTSKLLTYALGRGVEYYDEPAIRKIVRDAAADNYRWSSLILGIVRSAPFQMRVTGRNLGANPSR
jgi:mono/diheme cytochrome c family protein